MRTIQMLSYLCWCQMQHISDTHQIQEGKYKRGFFFFFKAQNLLYFLRFELNRSDMQVNFCRAENYGPGTVVSWQSLRRYEKGKSPTNSCKLLPNSDRDIIVTTFYSRRCTMYLLVNKLKEGKKISLVFSCSVWCVQVILVL